MHNHLRHIIDSVIAGKEDLSKFIKIMDECNVKAVVDLDGYIGETLDNHLKVLKGEYTDRFLVYARIDWSRIDKPDFTEIAVKQLEEAVKKRCSRSKNLEITWS